MSSQEIVENAKRVKDLGFNAIEFNLESDLFRYQASLGQQQRYRCASAIGKKDSRTVCRHMTKDAPGLSKLDTLKQCTDSVMDVADGVSLWFGGDDLSILKSFVQWYNTKWS